MWHAGHLRRKLNSEGNGASFLFFSLKALHASAPLSFCDLSPTKTPAHQNLIPGALSSQTDSYRRNQLLFCKHHLQHPSQLCVMHIEHCNMLTATGFESTFTITASSMPSSAFSLLLACSSFEIRNSLLGNYYLT